MNQYCWKLEASRINSKDEDPSQCVEWLHFRFPDCPTQAYWRCLITSIFEHAHSVPFAWSVLLAFLILSFHLTSYACRKLISLTCEIFLTSQ